MKEETRKLVLQRRGQHETIQRRKIGVSHFLKIKHVFVRAFEIGLLATRPVQCATWMKQNRAIHLQIVIHAILEQYERFILRFRTKNNTAYHSYHNRTTQGQNKARQQRYWLAGTVIGLPKNGLERSHGLSESTESRGCKGWRSPTVAAGQMMLPGKGGRLSERRTTGATYQSAALELSRFCCVGSIVVNSGRYSGIAERQWRETEKEDADELSQDEGEEEYNSSCNGSDEDNDIELEEDEEDY
ncbi:hypothetical protein CR513_45262, partial [Mucuna pruriens]